MKKIITMAVLIFSSMLTYACTGGAEQKQAETQKTAQEGSVIVMNKAMFIKDIFDYEKSKEWKYKGDKPAIIDWILSSLWLPIRTGWVRHLFRKKLFGRRIT